MSYLISRGSPTPRRFFKMAFSRTTAQPRCNRMIFRLMPALRPTPLALGQFDNRIRKGKLSRIFFMRVSLFAKFLIAFCTFLMLAETASIEAATQGFMEGHLKIVWMRAVERSDEMPRAEVAPESYAQYPLIILTEKEKKEVARVTADESGNYRVALTPGAYILDVQNRRAQRIHANPQSFTVTANQTIRVDLSIFIGFAKGQASVSSN